MIASQNIHIAKKKKNYSNHFSMAKLLRIIFDGDWCGGLDNKLQLASSRNQLISLISFFSVVGKMCRK
jgi:hypothetical protein